jgi:hypothetical protein
LGDSLQPRGELSMDQARYFERWFQSYCESERSHWLQDSMKRKFREAAYEAFNEGMSFASELDEESDLTNEP